MLSLFIALPSSRAVPVSQEYSQGRQEPLRSGGGEGIRKRRGEGCWCMWVGDGFGSKTVKVNGRDGW